MKSKSVQIPTTVDLLEKVRALISKERNDGKPVSDYAVAKRLGWKPNRIYNYKAGVSALDDEGCASVAEVLGWPVETVLACVYLERSKKQNQDERITRAWVKICQGVALSGALLYMGFSSYFYFPAVS